MVAFAANLNHARMLAACPPPPQLAHRHQKTPHEKIAEMPNHAEIEQALEVSRAVKAYKPRRVRISHALAAPRALLSL